MAYLLLINVNRICTYIIERHQTGLILVLIETSTKLCIIIVMFTDLASIMNAKVLSLSICCDVFQRLKTRVKCAVEAKTGCVLPLIMEGHIFTCARANPVPLASVTGP